MKKHKEERERPIDSERMTRSKSQAVDHHEESFTKAGLKSIQTSKEFINGKWQKGDFFEDKAGRVVVKVDKRACSKRCVACGKSMEDVEHKFKPD